MVMHLFMISWACVPAVWNNIKSFSEQAGFGNRMRSFAALWLYMYLLIFAVSYFCRMLFCIQSGQTLCYGRCSAAFVPGILRLFCNSWVCTSGVLSDIQCCRRYGWFRFLQVDAIMTINLCLHAIMRFRPVIRWRSAWSAVWFIRAGVQGQNFLWYEWTVAVRLNSCDYIYRRLWFWCTCVHLSPFFLVDFVWKKNITGYILVCVYGCILWCLI